MLERQYYLENPINMQEKDLNILIEKYLAGKCSDEEKEIVEHWYESFDDRKIELQGIDANRGWERIQRTIRPKSFRVIRSANGGISLLKLAIAAALLVIVSITAVYILGADKSKDKPAIAVVNDALPGTDRATLITNDGKKINLDDLGIGAIDKQVSKTDSGQIAYTGVTENVDAVNTLVVPRGGQYRLTLSDGTKVWLNADSRLSYPVVFGQNERRVILQGEGYFEVAHDISKPFTVEANNTETVVLGTHFNINAYADNKYIKTTLLEGLVKFKTINDERLVHPNEQAVYENTGIEIKNLGEYADNAVGWKDGYFKLVNAPVDDIMKQLARWYNVEVKYKGRIPQGHISGDIARSMALSSVLKVLELSGVHATIQNNMITVLQE